MVRVQCYEPRGQEYDPGFRNSGSTGWFRTDILRGGFTMKILVLGGGGREHALVWKIAQSPLITKIFCAPGNAGISQQAGCIDLPSTNVSKLIDFCRQQKID